jgi:hypothetical protein
MSDKRLADRSTPTDARRRRRRRRSGSTRRVMQKYSTASYRTVRVSPSPSRPRAVVTRSNLARRRTRASACARPPDRLCESRARERASERMKKCMKYAPKVSLGHVANLVFATGGGRLDDAHGGAHGERGTDYSSLFVRVSGARAGTTTWMTSIVSDFHILFDESRTVDFECKARAYPISSKSSIRRFVTLRLGR